MPHRSRRHGIQGRRLGAQPRLPQRNRHIPRLERRVEFLGSEVALGAYQDDAILRTRQQRSRLLAFPSMQ